MKVHLPYCDMHVRLTPSNKEGKERLRLRQQRRVVRITNEITNGLR
jgi:hypothetical protein